ncbi:conserved Plasmodium protein, unknown function [Plasmodium gallinaceum]|uniref:Rhoptry-associated protein 1 n=1 Tax=Plasmodium gallinaceum TaxID=5849 RepID=A0A1J1GZW4_PLAGA|nr:conserved Plasmodium protein, unknown function [Plasmodium gallinaceum]CRG98120.1 conserved Plasmodium protein, unknown function [Plasmodium gallinaceum]
MRTSLYILLLAFSYFSNWEYFEHFKLLNKLINNKDNKIIYHRILKDLYDSNNSAYNNALDKTNIRKKKQELVVPIKKEEISVINKTIVEKLDIKKEKKKEYLSEESENVNKEEKERKIKVEDKKKDEIDDEKKKLIKKNSLDKIKDINISENITNSSENSAEEYDEDLFGKSDHLFEMRKLQKRAIPLIKDTEENEYIKLLNSMNIIPNEKYILSKRDEKNYNKIMGYSYILLSEINNDTKLIFNTYLKRIFDLLLSEKLVINMCNSSGEISFNLSEELIKVPRFNCNTSNININNLSNKKCNKYIKECKSEKESTAKDCNQKILNCFLSFIKNGDYLIVDHLYEYYSSLEDIIKKTELRNQMDYLYKNYTFHPLEENKDVLKKKVHNKIFIEALGTILFNKYRKNKKYLYSSYIIVIDTLFSAIRKKIVASDMFKFVESFFVNIFLLHKKFLGFLLRSPFYIKYKLFYTPNLSKRNFENTLTRIYSSSVLDDLLNNELDDSKPEEPLKNTTNGKKEEKYNFIEISKNSNESLLNSNNQIQNALSGENDVLCKYIPIKKKVIYEKLNVTKKIAEEAILSYLVQLLLKKVHKYVVE